MKLAFVFPGQGSQYVGMGQELYENYASARDVFHEASDALGFNMKNLCFNGPEADLTITSNTQPAILTVSIACMAVLKENGIQPDIVAGHSLGEYSAMVAAGSLTFAEAVKIVHERGTFMQECAEANPGGMAAILGLDRESVLKACNEASDLGIVMVANFNCPGQIVISGEMAALENAMKLAQEYGAKRAIQLQVSGPFHSTLMTDAGKRLETVLEKVNFANPQIPLVPNVTGKSVNNTGEFKDLLVKQVSGSVLWEDSVRTMTDLGVNTFIEVGPGKVLVGLGKKITKESTHLNVENMSSLEITLDKMKEVL